MTDEHESRLTALTRIEAALDRLERHMVTLTKVNDTTRRMFEEDRAAIAAQFPDAQNGARPATAGSGQTRAPLAAGDKHTRHGRTGPIRLLPGYISQSFLRG